MWQDYLPSNHTPRKLKNSPSVYSVTHFLTASVCIMPISVSRCPPPPTPSPQEVLSPTVYTQSHPPQRCLWPLCTHHLSKHMLDTHSLHHMYRLMKWGRNCTYGAWDVLSRTVISLSLSSPHTLNKYISNGFQPSPSLISLSLFLKMKGTQNTWWVKYTSRFLLAP